MEWVLLCEGCVSPPIQEMRLAVRGLGCIVQWPCGMCGLIAGFWQPGDTLAYNEDFRL